MLIQILTTFLLINKEECTYIQGLDSICAAFYITYAGTEKINCVLPLMKQLHVTYLRPFIERDTTNLNFKYANLLMTRLTSFYIPRLSNHFTKINFMHDFYLVQWFMTLFAHTLPINQV